jgi:hypothetical protein
MIQLAVWRGLGMLNGPGGITPWAESVPVGAGDCGEVAGDFGGEVAAFYARYRRGYPSGFIDMLPDNERT